jgi:cadmium resistance protein CadD (predicted permease)
VFHFEHRSRNQPFDNELSVGVLCLVGYLTMSVTASPALTREECGAVLETAILALTAFASTNIDDAFVLLAFFGNPRFKGRDVVIGQYAGMVVLTLAAVVLALLAYAIPDRYVGLMGVLPVLVGIERLWKAWRERHESDHETDANKVKLGAWGGIAAVAGVTIANCGDNIAVYVPLFAKASTPNTLAICGLIAVMVAVWCFAAQFLIRHRAFGAIVRRWGQRVTPFILIALGLHILLRSGALAMIGSRFSN